MDEEAKKAQEAEEAKKAEEQKKADEAKKNQKTFTQEELESTLSERLKREREKADKAMADKLKAEREDWERQAKLTAEEKEAEERKKREEQTTAREREITLRENRAEARELLQEKSISSDLVEFVVDVDLDKTKDNIANLEKAFTKAVEAGIADRMKGKTPQEKINQSPADAQPRGTVVL